MHSEDIRVVCLRYMSVQILKPVAELLGLGASLDVVLHQQKQLVSSLKLFLIHGVDRGCLG